MSDEQPDGTQAAGRERERGLVDDAWRQTEELRQAENETSSANRTIPSPDRGARFTGPPPDSFTGYKIVRELHRGGQGVVYQAIQQSTKRKVAIKVMKEGPFAGSADRARFDREVQVLGQLNHPHIVAIHDTGSAAGHFYFVMDYVPGHTLDVYMAGGEHSIDGTLRLFGQICEAVNVAHLRGVIHRDLKPGNIRIDDEGEPHILDFGLAKVAAGEQEASLMTMTGQFVGSLPWASPEQAEGQPGKIDVRTDVYSLGVILYQMLTGKFPYEVIGNMRDVLDRIMKAEPARPSTVRKQINDEVETIVLKCLSKGRDRRYQTAGELARDVEHYLKGEPIEAKRDSTAYILRKQLKRYRVPAAIMAAFILLVTVGLLTSLMFWRQAVHKADEAEHARLAETKQRKHADTERAKATAVLEFLNQDLLAAVSPEEQGREVTMRAVLAAASKKLAEKFADRPTMEASIRMTIGGTYLHLGEYAEGERHLSAALEIRQKVLGKEHQDTLTSASDLALAYYHLGRYDECELLNQRVLEVRSRLPGAEHPDTLTSMHNLAGLYMAQSRYEEARPLYERAHEDRRRVLGNEHVDTASTMSALGMLYNQQGRYEEAEPLHKQALELQRRLLGHEHPRTLITMNNLAAMYLKQSCYDDAEPLLVETLEIQRRVLGEEHEKTLVSMNNLAYLYSGQLRFDQAQPLTLKVLEIKRRVLGPEHPTTLTAMNSLAMLYNRQGQPDRAEQIYAETLEISRQVLGERHWDTAITMHNLACVYRDQGKYDEADPLFRQAVTVAEEVMPAGHWATALFRCNWGGCLTMLGQYAEAERQLKASYEALEAAGRRTGLVIERFVELYEAWSRPQETAEWRAKLPPDRSARLLTRQGMQLIEQGRHGEAEPLLRECLTIQEEALDEGDWRIRYTLSVLGESLAGQGKFAEAEPLLIDGCEQMYPPLNRAGRKREALERIIRLYEAWHAAEPGQGYAEKPAEWRAKLEEWQTTTRPATTEEAASPASVAPPAGR